MPSTFQALLVVILAVLPGALYTWGFEQEDGAWGIGLSDRLYRFLGASAVFAIGTLPLIYELYRQYVVTGALRRGEALPWWTWLLLPALLLIPAAVGMFVGWSTKRGHSWFRLVVGPAPAPRGWDQLFRTPQLAGYVRLRLIDGSDLIGVWATKTDQSQLPGSYAAGFPHTQDLYFVDTCLLAETGEWQIDPETRAPLRTGVAALIRWDQVAYAEFIEAPEETRR